MMNLVCTEEDFLGDAEPEDYGCCASDDDEGELTEEDTWTDAQVDDGEWEEFLRRLRKRAREDAADLVSSRRRRRLLMQKEEEDSGRWSEMNRMVNTYLRKCTAVRDLKCVCEEPGIAATGMSFFREGRSYAEMHLEWCHRCCGFTGFTPIDEGDWRAKNRIRNFVMDEGKTDHSDDEK